jgi:hypothetical protein
MAEVARHNMEQDYLRERERTLIANKALWDEVSVGDSPGGPLKQLGKPHMKPAKSQG